MEKYHQRLLLAVIVLLVAAVGIATRATAQIIIEYPIPTTNSNPSGITLGPEGALWFTELTVTRLGGSRPPV